MTPRVKSAEEGVILVEQDAMRNIRNKNMTHILDTLRDKNIKTDLSQRKLLAKINSLFGSLLFISDNVDEYNEEQKRVLYNTFAEKDVTIQRAELIRENVMDIDYCENGKKKSLRFNVQTGRSEA